MNAKEKDITEQIDYLGPKTKRLREIVAHLKAGDRPLEELVGMYEEGLKLSADCKKYLSKLEGQIIEINKTYSDAINK